ncbi:MAG: hypothetical protein JW732_02770 [Dehalococcoidia bacterium]|nr:hypothetical protein [Dehalococcoidia bacterium]
MAEHRIIAVRRLTAGLRADAKRTDSAAKILNNRYLYKRSYSGGNKD